MGSKIIGDAIKNFRDDFSVLIFVLMSIPDFIETLRKERRFSKQIVELRYIPPKNPEYSKLSISKNSEIF
ncbi:MAG: hypothetical protein ACUVUQ_09960 [Thermodesulfovibrionales bacterium]